MRLEQAERLNRPNVASNITCKQLYTTCIVIAHNGADCQVARQKPSEEAHLRSR